MLQTAGNTVCSKRKHFNRLRSISLFSFLFKRLPSPETNAVTNIFYSKELGLPFLLHFLWSDRLAPYCPYPLLAGTLLLLPPSSWHLTAAHFVVFRRAWVAFACHTLPPTLIDCPCCLRLDSSALFCSGCYCPGRLA